MALLIFLLILSTLVLVHEMGHFFMARKLGIKVEEFGLGLPPRILGKKFGETIYSINALPFGGFVRLEGEDPEEVLEDPSKATDKRSFQMKTPFQRSLVLVAGVFMNFVLAVTLFYIVLANSGFKTAYMPQFFDYKFAFGKEETVSSLITGIEPDSAAEKNNIDVGEVIMEINGETVRDVKDVRRILKQTPGKEAYVFLMDIRKDTNNVRKVTLMPQPDEDGDPVLGVYLSSATRVDYNEGLDKYLSGFMHTYNVMNYSMKAMGYVIGLSVSSRDLAPVSETVAGPVGIYNIVGGLLDYGGDAVVINLLDFMALMSASLAFLNIMPFPALDGGRLLFVVYEGITKRRVNPTVELKLHKFGFFLLLGLLVVVTIKDIFKLF